MVERNGGGRRQGQRRVDWKIKIKSSIVVDVDDNDCHYNNNNNNNNKWTQTPIDRLVRRVFSSNSNWAIATKKMELVDTDFDNNNLKCTVLSNMIQN